MVMREIEDEVPVQTFEELVEEAGLKYSNDLLKGFSRVGEQGSFKFLDKRGNEITEEKVLQRINGLKIPPAWTEVWISPLAKGHLQATGKDAKGRKQYIYHQDWGKLRCETKFHRMKFFGSVLPAIREKVEKDLKIKELTKEKVLATVVGLLDHTLVRIGNRAYARDNKSFGLTTLRDRHMKAVGKDVMFEFVGKKGVKQQIKVTDSKLASIVKKCKDIPGYELFQYYDYNKNRHAIQSHDVNDYLKSITGEEISAKDFRTWGSSSYAIKLLLETELPNSQRQLKKSVNEIIKTVAEKLGNTATVCKKHYLHPIIVEAYNDNIIQKILDEEPEYYLNGPKLLYPEEKLFLRVLEKV